MCAYEDPSTVSKITGNDPQVNFLALGGKPGIGQAEVFSNYCALYYAESLSHSTLLVVIPRATFYLILDTPSRVDGHVLTL